MVQNWENTFYGKREVVKKLNHSFSKILSPSEPVIFFTDLEVEQFKHFNASEKEKNYAYALYFCKKNPLLLNKQCY